MEANKIREEATLMMNTRQCFYQLRPYLRQGLYFFLNLSMYDATSLFQKPEFGIPYSHHTFSTPNESRTHNLRIRSALLYPIELWGHIVTQLCKCVRKGLPDFFQPFL